MYEYDRIMDRIILQNLRMFRSPAMHIQTILNCEDGALHYLGAVISRDVW
jgi:hypothetical protein